MIDIFAFAVIRELFAWIIENWEVFAGIILSSAAVVALISWIRATDKQQIHKTHVENIAALESLIKVRDITIDERNKKIEDLAGQRVAAEMSLEVVRSEYKIVSGIVLSELIRFEGDRIRHHAGLALLSSEIQIKDRQIVMLETKLAKDC